MGSDPRRKQKQKLKRQKKRTSQRRAVGQSPYGKLRHAGDIEACYINEDWEESRIASILALRKVPGGYALGAFLVDLTCLGLKDAWGRIDIGLAEFRDTLDRSRERVAMVRIPPETAWKLVAGGVRWAKDHEFRLPPRYERWVSVLGRVADCASADVDEFGTEDGKMVYVGPLEDLRKRLLGCSLEEFIAREDVHYISPVDRGDLPDNIDWDEVEFDDEEDVEGSEDDEDDEDDFDSAEAAAFQAELETMVQSFHARMLDGVRQFLFSKSIQPHPHLAEAVELTIESVMQLPTLTDVGESGESEEPSEQEIAAADANLERFLAIETPESRAALATAGEQVAMYMRQFDNPEDMMKALGLDQKS